ncbi:type II toxin-antitoxin system RelB/DinJ family antitoxin [Maribrevibacterium harenarium]|uniref:Type II toxin-antitoxin system RelB/DinJ family antitoxin n=1 Tax=Maribrevibacterium harenarium TaxID=2589817 RepID=A0A501X0M0_9GAMM|nr:type II toxin-antitoxin system RelB/DinJ family antitoxin [Maribrevibacterium harenarium]TPE54097.1 type II toxin-antitoxin system RelB/DinJ family antitoxin [Maribrevibacterium harenarium]
MRSEMLSARIDADTKAAFTSVCDQVGLSPSQAIKLFAKAVINHGGLPFEVKVVKPNKTTAAAIQELVDGNGSKAESVSALLHELTDGKTDNVSS